LSARSAALGNGKKEGLALKARVNLDATITCQTIDRGCFISILLVSRFQRLCDHLGLREGRKSGLALALGYLAIAPSALNTYPSKKGSTQGSGS
jgi:hypothetical protein